MRKLVVFFSALLYALLPAEPALSGKVLTDVKCNGCVDESDISNNSIGIDQLKDSAVSSVKIEYGAITTEKIQDGAITLKKLALGVYSGNTAALQWVVRDSQGDQLGEVQNFDGVNYALVLFEVSGKKLAVEVQANGVNLSYMLRQASAYRVSWLYHTAEDCTDTTAFQTAGWYYHASDFQTRPLLSQNFSTGALAYRKTGQVYDLIEPVGVPETISYTHVWDLASGTCVALDAPLTWELYPGVEVIASDIFADYPPPYYVDVN